LSQDELYQRGAKLMESESLYDMKQGWTEYLEPLDRSHPDHPYKDEIAAFRLKWETAQIPHPSEAQRFFQQGEFLQKQGNSAAARKVWGNLIDAFSDIPLEKEWVHQARRALSDIDKASANNDRWKGPRAALARAGELQQQGKTEEAARIWTGLWQLYRDDPAAKDLLREVPVALRK
jgi:tetratricopeptide (TPR) repeat protein